LWVTGLLQLASWPRAINGTWVVSALIAGALSVLVAARLRRSAILAVFVVTGLAGLLGAAELSGLTTAGLWNLTVLYGLMLWTGVIALLRLPLTDRLAGPIGLVGGWGPRGGRRSVEAAIHWSCFALVLAGCLLTALARPDRAGWAIPIGSPAALAMALVFLVAAGRRYRLILHAHLGIAIGVWLGLSLYALLASAAGRTGVAPQDPLAGLVLGLMALGSVALAQWALRTGPAPQRGDTALGTGLFAVPLLQWAMGLASLSALQALTLALAGWSGPAACAIAALTFLVGSRTLRHAILTLAGASLAVLALSWTYSTAVHGSLPFGLSPGGPAQVDQWLVLVLLTLAVATLGRLLVDDPERERPDARPLLLLAWALLGWSLTGALALAATTLHGSITLALVWLVAAGVLFPLLGPEPEITYWRGAAVAALASLLLASLLGLATLALVGPAAVLAWAYALWIMGNLVLPPLDRRLGGWAIGGESWPWIGLLMLVLAAALAGPEVLRQWPATLGMAGYLFLLSRNTALPLHWLAVPAFAWAGVIWSGLAHLPDAADLSPPVLSTSAIKGLLWTNFLLLLAPAWDRFGTTVARFLGLPQPSVRAPLVASALALCLVWSLGIALWALPPALGRSGAGAGPELPGVSAIPAALLLSLTYLNLLWQWRGRIAADLTSLGVALALLVIWAEIQPFSLVLLGALWCGLLAALAYLLGLPAHWLSTLAAASAARWLIPSMVVTAALLVLPQAVPLGERLASLALLSGVAAHAGWHRLSRAWLVIALSMGLALVHGLWLLWIPVEPVLELLPGYALQTALLTWLLVWLRGRPRQRKDRADRRGAQPLLRQVLASSVAWLAALAVLEWAGQGVLLLLYTAGGLPSLPSSELPATLAYVAATTILVGLCVHQARLSQQADWVYAAAALVAGAALYLRLLWFGLAPLTPWDTAAMMASAYGLFLVGQLTLSRPVFHLMMALPLLALATVPYQLGSAHSALTLLAAGALYLLTRRTLHTETPLYLGLLAINGAIYLWLPDWSERFGLFQIYLVPATLTVLLLLHLHRRELKREVLHAARLGTLAALYAAATLDVFLVDNPWIFALALVVSLGGILMGIGLRIRAFLYAGVAFLVLNVVGQLTLLYPQHRLGKALMLMGLGTVITGAMIWFNLKRERLLQQIRVFRADLAEWE